MARTNIPVTLLTKGGIDVGSAGTEVTGDSTNNHVYQNGDNTFLMVRNSDASAHNVTFKIADRAKPDGATVTDPVVSIPASGHKCFRPAPAAIYDQTGSDKGKVYIDVDSNLLMLQAFKTG